jgi:ankyrin repeat protein
MELLAYGQPASISEESTGLVQDFLLARTDAELSILSRLLGEERAGRVRENVRNKIDAVTERDRERAWEQAPPTPTLHALALAMDELYDVTDDVERALAAGADIDATDGERRTALWLAAANAQLSLLRALIARGADLNKPATKKRTPAWAAAASDHADVVRLLVDAGANLTAGPSTPLAVACKRGHIDVVRELLRGGARDETGGALFAAVEAADAELVALMCDSGGSPVRDDKGKGDALIHACKMRYHDVVVALLSRGADVYRTFHEFDDATPMMWAIEPTMGRPLVEHEWVPDEALAKLLVEHGCDVDRLQGPGMKFGDETHTWGTRLVDWAASRDYSWKQTTYVDLLCATLGADVNLRSNKLYQYREDDWRYCKTSALDTACHHGHFALVERLVDTYGARVHTPLRTTIEDHTSCRPSKMLVDLLTPVQWLVYENLEYSSDTSVSERLMCFRFLVRRGAQVSHHDALEYQQCHVAHRLEGLERVAVAQVEKLQPVLQLGAEMLAVARHQERARRAAVAREILLLRSGRATVDGDCEDARLGRGASLLARISLKGAFGQRFARRVLDHVFDDGRSPRVRKPREWEEYYEGASPCALERRHREVYEAAVGHALPEPIPYCGWVVGS